MHCTNYFTVSRRCKVTYSSIVASSAALNMAAFSCIIRGWMKTLQEKTVTSTDQQKQSVPVSLFDSVRISVRAWQLEQRECCQLIVPLSPLWPSRHSSTPVVISATFPCCTRCPLVLFGSEHNIFPKGLPQPFCFLREPESQMRLLNFSLWGNKFWVILVLLLQKPSKFLLTSVKMCLTYQWQSDNLTLFRCI